MDIDDSFTKPGSVPFKWEIRPGLPKPHPPPSNHHTSPLKPPPSSPTHFHFPSPRTQSGRFQFNHKPVVGLGQPNVVSLGCFQARKGYSQRKTNKFHVNPMYKSDLEMLSEWSMSTRKSGSPLCNESPLSSSSFSSYRSSPRMVCVSDAEWAGYGLF
ncbi:hypothetical protein L1987_44474 [Smallanthus sonchifolius]|uniref:Uncharacterized protein n=1 Tax=Smallanthus sonchifolius TaxID=185202 RepID=A0ACB9GQL3_9ASTR|nr:hypothetical protein L1987_44474 [Smallanthus sonchifolius]